jgi:hypothetical protein
VGFDGTDWFLASADHPDNAEVIGIITETEIDSFTINTHGYITTLSGLIPGDLYFLDPDLGNQGGLTNITPDPEYVSKPLFIAYTETSGFFFNWRGMLQGSQGDPGIIGPQGYQGDQGATGDQGEKGDQGDRGYQGNKGDQGSLGYQGYQGNQGRQGPQGYQGNRGYQGYQGLLGYQGIIGYQGQQGYQGNQGSQGLQGYQGSQGLRGYQGYQGLRGYQGYQGLRGYQGYQGYQGNQGPQGDAGEQGIQGYQGYQGISGNSEATSIVIDDPGHSFSIGDIVGFDGTDWFLASADHPDNAEVIGIITETEIDSFTINTHGYITTLSGLIPGDLYFLDPDLGNQGGLTNITPDPEYVSKPIFIA